MSRFLAEKFAAMEPYTPGEQPQDMKYIKLNTNESPYPPSPKVRQALLSGGAMPFGAEAQNQGEVGGQREEETETDKLRLYSDPEAKGLCAAIAEYWGVAPEQVAVGNGSDEILAFAFQAFGSKGKHVSFPAVSYGFYPVFAELFQLTARQVPLKPDFTVDPQDYAQSGGMVVIANPNAPTGIALSLPQIEEVLKSNRDQLVLIDEAYVDFGAESAVQLLPRYDNLMVVQTFSKSRSLAGARLGFALASREIIEDINKMKFSFNPYNVNRLSMLAGVAAMEDTEYFEQCRSEIIKTRQFTAERLTELGFSVLPSKANFLFAKCGKGKGSEYFKNLREKGILVRYWNKPGISDYVRITIGTREDMETLCSVTAAILAEQ